MFQLGNLPIFFWFRFVDLFGLQMVLLQSLFILESLCTIVLFVGIDNNVKEKKRRNHRYIKDTRNYLENLNREKSRSHTQIHYLSERLQERRRESHSRSVQWYSQ